MAVTSGEWQASMTYPPRAVFVIGTTIRELSAQR